MKKSISLFLAALLVCTLPVTVCAQAKKEPLVEKVKRAIDKGISYLRQNQLDDGSWNVRVASGRFRYGTACLATLALLEAGVPVNDENVKKGLNYVRQINHEETYVVALQAMVLAKAGLLAKNGLPVDREKIRHNAMWLLKAGFTKKGKCKGWTYGAGGGAPDGSNTQYALLGLWAAKEAGIDIPKAAEKVGIGTPDSVWKSIQNYYARNQVVTQNGVLGLLGHWEYKEGIKAFSSGNDMTMTTAGVCGLLIAGMEIKKGRETLRKNGPALGCGAYEDNRPLALGMKWINANFRKELPGRTFYNLYGIERLGRLTGQRFFGNHDWYREGCDYLVKNQHSDGSWWISKGHDEHPAISTSFALLFLSKGRTPILISRVVHGAWPRNEADHDWNNDRYGLKHLTKFASQNLFKRLPLAWQSFDVMKAVESHGGARVFDELDVTAEMLQSPIFFINGHTSPLNRFTDAEIAVLKKYIENGGFIIAEACCGSKDFDAGFRRLMDRMFPNAQLTDLPANHPIWKAHFSVPAGSFGLQGLQMGCKTVLVYAPQDMSCRWEANLTEDESFDGKLAFKLAANIIAYATGLEPPKPRLWTPELVRDTVKVPPRGFLKAAQIKYQGDWQPAPQAIRNLMDHLRKYAGLDAALQPEPMPIYHEDIGQYKFLYLHGRGDPKFDQYSAKELENFKFNLETGAVLLADACCGNDTFDTKFRKFLKDVFPKHKLEQVPFNDVLFSKDLNRKYALTRDNIRCRQHRGGQMRPMAPWLEGIKINGRWAILYSKYDIGCALERHQSSDCRGYDYESAKKIAGAAVLYLLRP